MIIGSDNGVDWRQGYGGTREYLCPVCHRWVKEYQFIPWRKMCQPCIHTHSKQTTMLTTTLDQALEHLHKAQQELELAILCTATGPARNEMCDAAIDLMSADLQLKLLSRSTSRSARPDSIPPPGLQS